jgi:four helix bundle protein
MLKGTVFRAIHVGDSIAPPAAMTPAEMKQRTKKFAVDVIRFTSALPRGIATDVISRQLIRAGTGTAANYRASCRAKSRKDFIMKLSNAEEEADESALWLEVLVESGFVRQNAASRLLDEADQLTRIFVSSIITARKGSVGARIKTPKSPINPQSAIRNP